MREKILRDIVWGRITQSILFKHFVFAVKLLILLYLPDLVCHSVGKFVFIDYIRLVTTYNTLLSYQYMYYSNTYMRIGLNSKQTQNHFLFTRVLTIKNNASLWSWSILFSTNTVVQGKLHEIYQFHTLLETQFTSFIFSVQEVQDIMI